MADASIYVDTSGAKSPARPLLQTHGATQVHPSQRSGAPRSQYAAVPDDCVSQPGVDPVSYIVDSWSVWFFQAVFCLVQPGVVG